MDQAIPSIAELRGLWRRSMIAWPDGTRDTTTNVRWLQGLRSYIDLRQPMPVPDFPGVRSLADLSIDDCAWLAKQQGFAGHLGFDGGCFEWQRSIDFQPRTLHADAGSLHWDGEVLVERGRDVAYIEHWHRDQGASLQPVCAALALREIQSKTQGVLLRVGAVFMFARDRVVVPAVRQTLGACVAEAPTLEHAQQLIDCEISFGTVSPGAFAVTASSLPYRIGDVLDQRLTRESLTTMDRAKHGGTIRRQWEIVDREGELSALDAQAGL